MLLGAIIPKMNPQLANVPASMHTTWQTYTVRTISSSTAKARASVNATTGARTKIGDCVR